MDCLIALFYLLDIDKELQSEQVYIISIATMGILHILRDMTSIHKNQKLMLRLERPL
jgi:hypothetical protein